MEGVGRPGPNRNYNPQCLYLRSNKTYYYLIVQILIIYILYYSLQFWGEISGSFFIDKNILYKAASSTFGLW
jgi:hypothetical protein